MSFLRMQESPSSATLGDSCIRRNDRNEAFETALIDDVRKNDIPLEFHSFHTLSGAWEQREKLFYNHNLYRFQSP
ncbi:MAG: hypothetical protein NT007_19195 [Candidatus Kapabacteria bacterium]|nr:hypothetical protein [Candidatus Kapabacteria bacterium]